VECGGEFEGRRDRLLCGSRRCKDRRYARLHPEALREKERQKYRRRVLRTADRWRIGSRWGCSASCSACRWFCCSESRNLPGAVVWSFRAPRGTWDTRISTARPGEGVPSTERIDDRDPCLTELLLHLGGEQTRAGAVLTSALAGNRPQEVRSLGGWLRRWRVALVRNCAEVRMDFSGVTRCLGWASGPTFLVTLLITISVAGPEATPRHQPEIEQRKFQLHDQVDTFWAWHLRRFPHRPPGPFRPSSITAFLFGLPRVWGGTQKAMGVATRLTIREKNRGGEVGVLRSPSGSPRSR